MVVGQANQLSIGGLIGSKPFQQCHKATEKIYTVIVTNVSTKSFKVKQLYKLNRV